MSQQKKNLINSENLRIGRQIRDLRKAKDVTLMAMAQSIGRSVGYLSQVERGVSSLPIPVLQSICEVLAVNISWFFHTNEPVPVDEMNYVVRASNRRSLSFTGTGIREELLSPRLSGQMQMVLSTYAPGAGSEEARQRKGEEGGYVQSGQLRLKIGSKEFLLKAGDSFTLEGEEPHWASNPSTEEEAVVVWTLPSASY